MAVPSSGQLRLYADIGTELGVAQSNVSLGSMSDTAGFPAPDAMSDFYGYTDASAPSVTTNNISNIGETSLTINGNITSDGGATITERGFYFGTNSSSPTNNTKYTVGGTTGYYSNNRTGLSTSTTYYCWAFATNSAGTTYGSRVQASTVAAFVPTFANFGSRRFQSRAYMAAAGAPTINYTFNTKKYYINPNTNSYVQIPGEEVHNFPSTGYKNLAYSTQDGDFSSNTNFATNAKNALWHISSYGNVASNNLNTNAYLEIFTSTSLNFTNVQAYSNWPLIYESIDSKRCEISYGLNGVTNSSRYLRVEFNYS